MRTVEQMDKEITNLRQDLTAFAIARKSISKRADDRLYTIEKREAAYLAEFKKLLESFEISELPKDSDISIELAKLKTELEIEIKNISINLSQRIDLIEDTRVIEIKQFEKLFNQKLTDIIKIARTSNKDTQQTELILAIQDSVNSIVNDITPDLQKRVKSIDAKTQEELKLFKNEINNFKEDLEKIEEVSDTKVKSINSFYADKVDKLKEEINKDFIGLKEDFIRAKADLIKASTPDDKGRSDLVRKTVKDLGAANSEIINIKEELDSLKDKLTKGLDYINTGTPEIKKILKKSITEIKEANTKNSEQEKKLEDIFNEIKSIKSDHKQSAESIEKLQKSLDNDGIDSKELLEIKELLEFLKDVYAKDNDKQIDANIKIDFLENQNLTKDEEIKDLKKELKDKDNRLQILEREFNDIKEVMELFTQMNNISKPEPEPEPEEKPKPKPKKTRARKKK